MMGSHYSDRQREAAKQLFAAGKTVAEVSRALTIKECTLYRWKAALEKSEDFQELANKKKEAFIEHTDRNINKGLKLRENTLDAALKEGTAMDISKLSTMIGTLYDKKALAMGEATERQDLNIIVKVED